MEAIATRLRNFMVCKGTECRDPTGLWPPPMPAGAKKLVRSSSKGGVCLETVGAGQVSVVPAGSCYAPNDAWTVGTDSLGNGQIENAADSSCLNLENTVCTAGTPIHMHECQGNDTKVHKADHWVFDASKQQLQQTECPGMCLGYAESAIGASGPEAGAPVTLQACGTSSTAGWQLQ